MEFGYSAFGAAGNIPAVHVKRAFADTMLQTTLNRSLTDIEESIAKDLTPISVPLRGWSAKVSVTVERRKMAVKNVIGALDGAG